MLHICTLHFDFCKYRSTSKHFLVRVDHCPLRSKQRWVEGFQRRYRSDSGLKLQSKSHYVLIGWMTVLQSNKNLHEVNEIINVERVPLYSFTAVSFLIGFLCTSCMCNITPASRHKNAAWLTLEGTKETYMRGQQTCPLYDNI